MPNLHAHKFIRNEKVINAHTEKKHSANVKTVKSVFLCVCVMFCYIFLVLNLKKLMGVFMRAGVFSFIIIIIVRVRS